MKLRNVSFALFLFGFAMPGVASAESIDAAPQEPPCVGMWVSGPLTFPANATAAVRLTVQNGGAFTEYERPEIMFATDDGYEAVSFELAVDPDEPTRSRLVELDEQRPGAHIITWGGGDCFGMPSPVDASKTVVGSFEILQEFEPPTELGDLDVEESPYGSSLTLILTLDDSARPWQDLLEYTIEIDGEAVNTFAPTSRARNGEVRLNHYYQCGDTFAEGVHSVAILGTVEGEELRTEARDAEFTCRESSGCSVGAAGSGTWLGVLLMVGLVGLRRRD